MSVPIRVVFEVDENNRDVMRFYTTFDLEALTVHGDLTEKGMKLHRLIAAIPGIAPGETAIQFGPYHAYISKIHAFRWNEIQPEIVKILKDSYGFTRIMVLQGKNLR